MKLKLLIVLICFIICNEGKKTYRSRSTGSSRGTSRKTNAQPAPTSLSYPQPSAPKPTLFGWQEKPSQSGQSFSSWQSKPSGSQSHSYPASNTGLSGNNNAKQPSSYQESYQKSNVPVQQTPTRVASPTNTNNQQSHSYPSSGGLSGSSGSGSGYPQQSKVGQPGSGQAGSSGGYPVQQGMGLSGSSGGGYPQQQASGVSGSATGYHQQQGVGLAGSGGAGYPQQHGTGLANTGAAPPPYSGYKPAAQTPNNNYGNNYYHPQGPPPPYSNHGPSYGGSGFPNSGYSPQTPGYFGNYANNGRGFGGMSRSGSALTGVGIAGAGVGTLLTGLALWNLARSTGQRHHTVIYDNRGQPVAVAPANNDTSVVDSMLADLANCSLTISTENKTEVLAIPCAIATSFTPDANVKDVSDGNLKNNDTKCTVSILTKSGQEFMTTIPCSILLNSAAENNVSEPLITINETENATGTIVATDDVNSSPPTPLRPTDADINNNNTVNCSLAQPGETRDPINPCFAVSHDLTVIPLQSTDNPNHKK